MSDDKNKSVPNSTTFDLKNHAAEALRLYEEMQRKEQAELKDVTLDVPLDEGNTTFDLSEPAKAARGLQDNAAGDGGNQPDTGFFGMNMLAELHILEAIHPLRVDIQGEMSIGRGDNTANFQPDIDMSPYGAYRLGLSRHHATLRRNGMHLELIDPGSRNGSSINGTQLDATVPVRLKDGDEVRLGNLALHLRFKEKIS
ncbi:MAG: FHA domain-containing protein [Aggregatilineales bacterium]